ncbi:NAD-dependent epimerase dehydratase [Colletotrichum plurivorum]|uniref:NAD-dependent epimerase dehydratase n=1 Tax=Colletotrichum plurivorum TaxID=2175906 RepID=A0A8H6KIT5_9PEZI|nr:NAD-dependent epimerase dehydratase [Colletotrichum plurivorum]
MAPTASSRILLTGATGYIGGSVLDALIKSPAPSLTPVTFDVLVRRQDQADKLHEAYGDRVEPVLWSGLNDPAAVADIAANYDLVVNAGLGFHPNGGKPFVEGLARGAQKGNGRVPWILHLSGCTNLADRPITGETFPDRAWDDADAKAVYEFMRKEEEKERYSQRTNEVDVLAAAEESGVHALSLNASMIFGEGKGLLTKNGGVLPLTMSFILKHGYGFKFNETAGIDWVHIEDLADLWVLIVRAILERPDRGVGYILSGTNGIVFPSVGRIRNEELMMEDDTPKTKEIRLLALEEAAAEITGGAVDLMERGWAGNKNLKGTAARRLFGWNPTRLREALDRELREQVELLQGSGFDVQDVMKSSTGLK